VNIYIYAIEIRIIKQYIYICNRNKDNKTKSRYIILLKVLNCIITF